MVMPIIGRAGLGEDCWEVVPESTASRGSWQLTRTYNFVLIWHHEAYGTGTPGGIIEGNRIQVVPHRYVAYSIDAA
jgi:hypothetical protein